MADRASLTAKLQRTLMQVQIQSQTWAVEQSTGPHQADSFRPPPAAAFEQGLEASYNFRGTLAECSLPGPGPGLAPSISHVAAGSKRPSELMRAQMQVGQQHVSVSCALNSTPTYLQDDVGALELDYQASRKRTSYVGTNSYSATSSDLEPARSDSWSSGSPPSSGFPENQKNMEAGHGRREFTVAPPDEGNTCEQPWDQSATMTYVGNWISDAGLDSHHVTLTDLLAYQVMHSDNAAMVEGMVSRLRFSNMAPTQVPVSARGAEVDNWMSVHLTAALPQTPECAMPDFEEQVVSSATPTLANQGTSSNAEVDSWMSSLMTASSPLTGEAESICGSEDEDEDHFPVPRSLDEITAMLMGLAEAVVVDDPDAPELFRRVREYSTPHGTHLQRLVHYVSQALMAKLYGTGADLFTAIKRNKPSVLESAKALKFFLSIDPTLAIAHHFSNSVLLGAFQGAERVHIIDYGIQNGHQWPILMTSLADRPEGPPRLRITGIELPQPGPVQDGMVRETGRRLARFAASLGIPFEYNAISAKWEDVQVSSLDLRKDEVLGVSSVFRLRHLLDDSVVLSNPRRTVLETIFSMNPRVFVTGVLNLAANTPSLTARLQEVIPFFARYFDAFESCTIPRDTADREIMEQEMLGRELLNLIACEGTDRRERPESYYQWHRRLVSAGFELLPLLTDTLKSTKDIVKYYDENWTIGHDNGWLLSGWKGGVQHASAAWQPARFQ